MTPTLQNQISAFRRDKLDRIQRAREIAALQLLTGIDLEQALTAGVPVQTHLLMRLHRLIERERQRGIRKHWSYNLDRHIALKQALDRLRARHHRAVPNKKSSA